MTNNLQRNVEEWINKEGIPLEYLTSSIYRKNNFRVQQGNYIIDNDKPREIDVAASLDFNLDPNSTLRISNIVECKWTKDKPWVVFTSPSTIMSIPATITQGFGSYVGDSLLWHMAGEHSLKTLNLFNREKPNGFSGRQALVNNGDLFYNTIQSLIAKTKIKISEHDKSSKLAPFKLIEVAFATIVIDGTLFETSFNDRTQKIELEEVNYSRIQWKGSSIVKFNAIVDIVTKDYLSDYVLQMKNDFVQIAIQATENIKNIKLFYATERREDLIISQGSRGVIGYPDFIMDIINGKHIKSA